MRIIHFRKLKIYNYIKISQCLDIFKTPKNKSNNIHVPQVKKTGP